MTKQLLTALFVVVMTYMLCVGPVMAQTTTPDRSLGGNGSIGNGGSAGARTGGNLADPVLQNRNRGLEAQEALKQANANALVDEAFFTAMASLGCAFGPVSLGCYGREGSSAGGAGVTSRDVHMILAGYIKDMYGKPASSTTYVADVLNSAGIATPAYAQGLGFAALDPILDAWKAFRNLAYLFFVVVVMVIGFMIMFRQKMGQAAITAQQALPNIVIALIAVTFSYAIAGLLIDAMYLFMFLIVSLFGNKSELLDFNFLQLGWHLVGGSLDNVDAVGEFVENTFAGFSEGLGDGLGVISQITFAVIIIIAVVINTFRLFFELLKTYIAIIISITLSPLLLMLGALPGKNVLGGWIKSLVGNLAVFPVVLLVLVLFDQLTNSQDGTITNGGFMPPYMVGTSVGSGDIIATLLGLGMILVLPEIVVQAKKALGASGGVFEQFGGALKDSLVARGYSGGQLIPGIAATDTSKYGLSGKGVQNLATKSLFGSKESKEKASKYQPNFFGRGILGSGYRNYVDPYLQSAAYRLTPKPKTNTERKAENQAKQVNPRVSSPRDMSSV